MSHTIPDWTQLQLIHELANNAQVSFTLTYDESDHSWYFTVISPAPEERWVGKNRTFDTAVKCLATHLQSIQPN